MSDPREMPDPRMSAGGRWRPVHTVLLASNKAVGVKSLEIADDPEGYSPTTHLVYIKAEVMPRFASLYIEVLGKEDRFNQIWTEHGAHLPIESGLSEYTMADFKAMFEYAYKVAGIILFGHQPNVDDHPINPTQPTTETNTDNSPFG